MTKHPSAPREPFTEEAMEAHSYRVRLNNTEQALKANDTLIDALLKRLNEASPIGTTNHDCPLQKMHEMPLH
jgi:hypothetical protein